MKLNGKTILVTGGGNGIGRQLVLQLLQKDNTVLALDLSQKALEETKELSNHHPKLFLYTANITSKDELQKTSAKIKDDGHTLDGYINVAGIIHPFVDVLELDDSVIERVMNVNFYGTLHMVRTFLPDLLKRPTAHIVHISSMGGFVPVPGQTIYGASKAAVKLLTEGLRSELKDTPVHVSVVFPGGVATEITKNSNVKLSDAMASKQDSPPIKLLTPQACASIIIKGMEKNKYHIIAGKDASFMYRFSRLAPKKAANIIQKMLKKVLN